MKQLLYMSVLLVLLTDGCTAKPESEDISDEQVTVLALEEGNRIAARAQQALGSQLMAAFQQGGPLHAVQFCNTAAYAILDTLTTGPDVTIKRISHRWRNPADAPSPQELIILESYLETLSAGKTVGPIIEVNEQAVMFTKPILLDKPLCLNCHGAPETQITPETMLLLNELYPEDNATGHEMGDLRGMWSLTFDKESLILYLKTLNKETSR